MFKKNGILISEVIIFIGIMMFGILFFVVIEVSDNISLFISMLFGR